jgi:hypothetical protein
MYRGMQGIWRERTPGQHFSSFLFFGADLSSEYIDSPNTVYIHLLLSSQNLFRFIAKVLTISRQKGVVQKSSTQPVYNSGRMRSHIKNNLKCL